jgi:membrane protein required for colicin V production
MIIDLIFVIVAGYGIYLGFSRGIIKTVFTVLAYVFGFVVAVKFSSVVTEFIQSAFSTESPFLFVPGFLLTFVLTILAIRTLANIFERGLETANVNLFNQVAGAVLTAAVTTLLFSVLVRFSDRARLLADTTKAESTTYPYLIEYPELAKNLLGKTTPFFEEFWDKSMLFIDKFSEPETDEPAPSIYDIDDEGKRRPGY